MPAERRPSVLIASGPWRPEPWANALQRLDRSRTVHIWPDAPGERGDIAYLMAWKPPQAALEGLDGLRLIFSLGAGVDHLAALRLPDVPVVRIIDDDMTERMTEWVVLQVLLHHRQHARYQRCQSARQWRELPQLPARDVRVGVMGMGVLGSAAAAALGALGFAVAGWSRRPKRVDGVTPFAGDSELGAFLQRTDILVSLLPLTDATRGLLARPLFETLARDGPLGGPVVINAGRGELQVEDDILTALEDGTLAGASLDVFAEEPLDPQSSLWTAPNLVITPHVSAPSSPEALTARIHRQITRYEDGVMPDGVIDPAAGY